MGGILMRAIVSVVGKDRVGIISSVCGMLSDKGINILDISQTILQEYFTMIMLVDISKSSVQFSDLVKELEQMGTAKGLDIHMQRAEIFEAMHRI